ncbi:hypothetical protein ACJX0J_014205, partial [Zea mays]
GLLLIIQCALDEGKRADHLQVKCCLVAKIGTLKYYSIESNATKTSNTIGLVNFPLGWNIQRALNVLIVFIAFERIKHIRDEVGDAKEQMALVLRFKGSLIVFMHFFLENVRMHTTWGSHLGSISSLIDMDILDITEYLGQALQKKTQDIVNAIRLSMVGKRLFANVKLLLTWCSNIIFKIFAFSSTSSVLAGLSLYALMQTKISSLVWFTTPVWFAVLLYDSTTFLKLQRHNLHKSKFIQL